MLRHLILAAVVALACLLLLSCGRPPPTVGPKTHHQTFGFETGQFTYDLTSNTDCGVIGAPITLTLVLTNSDKVAYSDTLTRSVIDIRVTTALTETERTWYWSEQPAAGGGLRTLTLAPGEGIRVQWVWRLSAEFALATYPVRLNIRPVAWYRNRQGRHVEAKSGGYLLIPVGSSSVVGRCPLLP